MNIGVLSDCRVPSRPTGNHGLGRGAVEVARALAARGHTVTLYGGIGSAWDGATVVHRDETERARTWAYAHDALFDVSHYHDVSRLRPELPVVNYLMDGECPYRPPRAVVSTPQDADDVPGARVLPYGMDVESIPFYPLRRQPVYLAYAARCVPGKGVHIAERLAQAQRVPVQFAGAVHRYTPASYCGELHGEALWAFLGRAWAVLQLTQRPARGGGLVSLEAAAVGTPVLALDTVPSVAAHVVHGVTGWLVRDEAELADAVEDMGRISPAQCRAWVKAHHSRAAFGAGAERLLQAAADGEHW